VSAVWNFLFLLFGTKLAAGIIDTGGKFATGINNTNGTGGKIFPLSSILNPGLTNISENFRKNLK
jgi:hypothetical protein